MLETIKEFFTIEMIYQFANIGVIPLWLIVLFAPASKFTNALINNLFILLFGCGYGCGLGAMDSGIVRLILEFGIVFSALIFFLSRYVTKYILFILIAVNFLFDAFWSSHVAPILFAGIFYNLVLNKTL